VLAAARETRAIATLEEHSRPGGLGSAVAEVLAELSKQHVPFRRIGLDSAFVSTAGSPEYLRKRFGLTMENIAGQLSCILHPNVRG